MADRITNADFDKKVIKSNIPVLVDYYSDSCVACKKLAPVLGGIEDDYEDKITVYKVNTVYESELVEQYQITANPTLVLFKNGEEVERRIGALSPTALQEWIEQYI